MPEIVEVKSICDFINKSKIKIYRFEVNNTHPHCLINDDKNYNQKHFPFHELISEKFPLIGDLNAEYRGKELKLILNYPETNHNDISKYEICVSLGFTGNFVIIDHLEPMPKYWHWSINYLNGKKLVFYCKRKLSRFRRGDFDSKRSPGINDKEWVDFTIQKIKNNDYQLSKPIYEYLMRQDRCNGVGNYMRSVILHRIKTKYNISPFLTAKEFFEKISPYFVRDIVREIILESYKLKGYQGTDWKNPLCKEEEYAYYKEKFFEWCKPYLNGNKIKDSQNRTFWYN
jgi:formamidopyrimidine-DNA glycosylase